MTGQEVSDSWDGVLKLIGFREGLGLSDTGSETQTGKGERDPLESYLEVRLATSKNGRERGEGGEWKARISGPMRTE